MIVYRGAVMSLDKKDIEKFLSKFNLKLEKDVDYTVIAEDDDNIIGTGSLSENVLKCFAIDSKYRGLAITNTIITKLIEKANSLNRSHLFIFTKPENEDIFKDFGFKTVAKVDEVTLLDNKIENLYKILEDLKNEVPSGVIVVNANPMTKGHLKIIQEAASRVEKLFVFVVSEDKSVFPYEFRYDIVKKACQKIENVEVIRGNDYIISRNTFPTYFYKDDEVIIEAYSKLDITIFGKYFAKAMNIKKRFVGKELSDKVTADYNLKMKEILPKYGVETVEIDRFKESGEVISASTVRKLLSENKIEEAKKLLPPETFEALMTDEGRKIIYGLQKDRKNWKAPCS